MNFTFTLCFTIYQTLIKNSRVTSHDMPPISLQIGTPPSAIDQPTSSNGTLPPYLFHERRMFNKPWSTRHEFPPYDPFGNRMIYDRAWSFMRHRSWTLGVCRCFIFKIPLLMESAFYIYYALNSSRFQIPRYCCQISSLIHMTLITYWVFKAQIESR